MFVSFPGRGLSAFVACLTISLPAIAHEPPRPARQITVDIAAPAIHFQVTHLAPRAVYHLVVHRTGYHANDAYSAYLEMGSPKDLTAPQVEHLNQLTRDAPETDRTVRSSPEGTLAVQIPMSSNDIVLMQLKPSRIARSTRGAHSLISQGLPLQASGSSRNDRYRADPIGATLPVVDSRTSHPACGDCQGTDNSRERQNFAFLPNVVSRLTIGARTLITRSPASLPSGYRVPWSRFFTAGSPNSTPRPSVPT
jgi:hypothetical protein